jgi:hypothetical protein
MSLGDFKNSANTPTKGNLTTVEDKTMGGAFFPPVRGLSSSHHTDTTPKAT